MDLENIVVDITQRNYNTLQTIQYDVDSRYVNVKVVNNGKNVDLTNYMVSIACKKPDGKIVFNETEMVEPKQGLIKFLISEQISSTLGEVVCELKIYGKNSSVLTTQYFTINVVQPIANKAIQSTNEFRQLTNAMNEYNKWIDKVEEKYNGLEEEYAEKLTSVGQKAESTSQSLIEVSQELDSQLIKLGEIKSQLSHLLVSPTGEDDTEMLQSALDTGRNILSLPNNVYRVSQPLRVKHSGQTIDLNHSTIIFNQNQETPHTTENNRTNDVGVFDLKAYVLGETVNIAEVDLPNGVFTVSSSDSFKVGDYAKLVINCGEYSESKLTPKINVVAEVVEVIDTKIVLNYSCDCWEVADWQTATIIKVTPQKDVTIQNVKIIDETPLRNGFDPNAGEIYPTDDSHYACCGIGISHGVNIAIKNVEHIGGLFNTIHSTYCYNSSFENITTKNPRLKNGGEGYSIQNIYFHKISIKNVVGHKTRHTLDFSGGGYATADNIRSYKSFTSDIQFHGQYEHDIVINNFNGVGDGEIYPYVNAGSGTAFGNAVANVTFNQSKLIFISSKNVCFFKNLVFNKSEVITLRLTHDVTFNECYVMFKECINKGIIRRGNHESRLVMNNSHIELMTTTESVDYYNTVEINGGMVTNNLGQQLDVILQFCGAKNVVVNGVSRLACGIKLTNDSATYGSHLIKTNISNNNFECYRYAGIWINDISSCKHATVINNNNFAKSSQTSSSGVYSIDFDGEYKKSSEVAITIIGNNSNGLTNNVNLMNNNSQAKCKCYANIGIDDLTK